MSEGALDRLLTLASLIVGAIAVADRAEALWQRYRDSRTPPPVVADPEPAWFAQARAEIDRLTHG